MNVKKLVITLLVDFHTTGTSQGSHIGVLRDDEGPYIPGSHIKGVIRTEAERIWFSAHDLIPCGITNMTKEFSCPNSGKCPICDIFGKPNQGDGTEYREGVLRFYDAHMNNTKGALSTRIHVSIDRQTESHATGALFSEKSIPRDNVFEGFMVSRRDLDDSEYSLVRGATVSAGVYGFGKNRSRGFGTVQIEIIESSIEELMSSKV